MKPIKKIAAVFLSLMVIGLLTRCGQPICVIDFGNCSVYDNWAGGASGTPSAGNLVITAPPNDVMIFGSTFTFSVEGGTPSYGWTITPTGFGTFTPGNSQATFISPQTAQIFTITVTDAAGLSQSVTVSVQATN